MKFGLIQNNIYVAQQTPSIVAPNGSAEILTNYSLVQISSNDTLFTLKNVDPETGLAIEPYEGQIVTLMSRPGDGGDMTISSGGSSNFKLPDATFILRQGTSLLLTYTDSFWRSNANYGLVGLTGDTGQTGDTGSDGSGGGAGYDGDPGDAGQTGDTGGTGQQGSVGETGQEGPAGTPC